VKNLAGLPVYRSSAFSGWEICFKNPLVIYKTPMQGVNLHHKKPIYNMPNTYLCYFALVNAPSTTHAVITLWTFPFFLENCGKTTLQKSCSIFVPHCWCWTWSSSPIPGCPHSTSQVSASPWPCSFTISFLQLSRGCAWSLFSFTWLLSKFSMFMSQSTYSNAVLLAGVSKQISPLLLCLLTSLR